MRTAAVLCTAMLVGPAGADVIYSQDVAGDGHPIEYGYFSHTIARNTHSFVHADDFELANSVTVESIGWWGIGEGVFNPDLTNVQGFRIEFYTADLTDPVRPKPGVLIASETFALGDTTPTPTGRLAPNNAIEYRHDVTLSASVELGAGLHFLSIAAVDVNRFRDGWLWRDSVDANQFSQSFDYSRNRWLAQFDTDSAFVLNGVPAPGSAATITLGACAAARRRR